ncbi:MAG: 4Fe-4S dicluster domain-containing protein [Nitrososphaerota archaeon]|jgi:ferredoxin|nr:4Fe-4S dicluster domain-containing protein [Nitrososphaerota archaeon]
MKRKIVQINPALCNGCGACIPKCAEGALQIINNKAQLIKDTYCDGLGACIGQCPQNAITVTEREAEAFDQKAVQTHLKTNLPPSASNLTPQWPLKLDLVPPKAPFFEDSDLLFVADCVPVVLKNFHGLTVGKRVLIGCPKFNDARAYAAKLTAILSQNNIKSITVVHMEVPCCTGLKWAVTKAIEGSAKQIPLKEYEVKIGGNIVEL